MTIASLIRNNKTFSVSPESTTNNTYAVNSCCVLALLETPCSTAVGCSCVFHNTARSPKSAVLLMMFTTKTNSGWPTPGGRKTDLARLFLGFPTLACATANKFPARVTFWNMHTEPQSLLACARVRFGLALRKISLQVRCQ